MCSGSHRFAGGDGRLLMLPAPPTAGALLDGDDTRSRLFQAITSSRSLEEARARLRSCREVDLMHAKDSMGWTLLMASVACGWVDLVRVLLRKGADVNATNNVGDSALFIALSHTIEYSMDILHVLLDKGADVNVTNKNKETPLLRAIACASTTHHRSSLVPAVQLLLESGASVDVSDIHNNTPLLHVMNDHRASSPAMMSVARLLLQKGANVNVINNFGRTPLTQAISHGSVAKVRMLIREGAHVNTPDSMGTSPLFRAVVSPCLCSQCLCIVHVLLDSGADITATDCDGLTPLQYASACDAPNQQVIKILLEAGAGLEIFEKNENGSTQLL